MNDKAIKANAATMVPTIINGVLLPFLAFLLSEIAPNNGSINKARMLSSAIMTPEAVWFKPNLSIMILAMILSYVCQKIVMIKKAKPINIVFL